MPSRIEKLEKLKKSSLMQDSNNKCFDILIHEIKDKDVAWETT